MKGYNWDFPFNPNFPLHIFPFTVTGNRDPMHWHYYLEIGLCLKGTGQFIYLNQTYTVQEGDIFFSGNYESHVAISEEGRETKYLFLGNTAQKKVPDTAKCDIINLWINR